MRKGLTYSVCIHAVLLSLLAVRGCAGTGAGMKLGGPEQEQKTAEQEKGALEAQQEIQVDIIPPTKKVEGVKTAEADGPGTSAHASDECADFFGGVGVEIEYRAVRGATYGVIEKVYPGYPASTNGFQVGDVIVNPTHLRGPIGTLADVELYRDGQQMHFKVVRDKICTTPPKNKKESP